MCKTRPQVTKTQTKNLFESVLKRMQIVHDELLLVKCSARLDSGLHTEKALSPNFVRIRGTE